MRRIATMLLGIAALAATTAVPAATATAEAHAAPASATSAVSPSGYVLYKSYGWPDACSSAGYAGQQSGQWRYYYCQTIQPASWDAPGLYDLFVSY